MSTNTDPSRGSPTFCVLRSIRRIWPSAGPISRFWRNSALTYTSTSRSWRCGRRTSRPSARSAKSCSSNSNTLTPILKKLEELGYLRRQRDPADERQVRVSLTSAGRRLRERALEKNLVEESGLAPKDFVKLQQAVVTLRDNLVKAAKRGP